MSFDLTHRFEDLPSRITYEGLIVSFVSGYAEVSYDEDGEWGIDAIEVEGAYRDGREGKVVLDRQDDAALWSLIFAGIEKDVDEAVREALAWHEPEPLYEPCYVAALVPASKRTVG